MSKKITKDRIVELLQAGWELGMSTGLNQNAWMQRRLMCGGESFDCNMKSFDGLYHRGVIRGAPKRKNDPFWLARYSLAKTVE